MSKNIYSIFEDHNHFVGKELRRSNNTDFISLTKLLISKGKVIKEIYKINLAGNLLVSKQENDV